jgi:hypothetical protein
MNQLQITNTNGLAFVYSFSTAHQLHYAYKGVSAFKNAIFMTALFLI